ncbi:hypothetical protein CEP53_013966 [Fusarium sp. AF-6]|nr:hypothetical protein CEP53_013966 [Fusarium sp. AF-6]
MGWLRGGGVCMRPSSRKSSFLGQVHCSKQDVKEIQKQAGLGWTGLGFFPFGTLAIGDHSWARRTLTASS